MINSFSIIMSLVLFTIVSLISSIFLAHIKSRHLWTIGLCLALCVLRCILPIEFPGVHNVNVWNIYPKFFAFLEKDFLYGLHLHEAICVIWLTGCLVLWGRQAFLLLKQLKLNRIMLHQSQNERFCMVIENATSAVHCESDVNVYVTDMVTLPLMTGFSRPIILLPTYVNELNDLEVEYILRHEIAHYKGGDNWYKLAFQMFTYFLWWNPVAYLMRRSINQWLELRCDQHACQFMQSGERLTYSALLLRLVKKSSTAPKRLIATGFVGTFEAIYLTQRLRLLVETPVQRNSRLLSGLIAGICILLFLGSYSLIVQPAYTPPEVEGNSPVVGISPETAWLVPTTAGKYEVWVDGSYYVTLSPEAVSSPPFDQLPIHEKEN